MIAGPMSQTTKTVSYKGKEYRLRALPLGPNLDIVIQGRIVKIGKIRNEFWMRSKDIPDIPAMVEQLRGMPGRPDLLMVTQKLPDVQVRYPYHLEWDNLAVAHFTSYDGWFKDQVARDARSQIRKAGREGVRTEVVPLTDELAEGICAIYNEIPVRQGRKFWHYGKDAAAVKRENSSYLDRSLFIGAYHGQELIGFIKLVFDGQVAHILQILSKSSHFLKRPNNALLAKAVEVAASQGAHDLTYGGYVYGKKEHSSLIEFKKSLGFQRVDVPRYWIPLTAKGRLALKLGLQRSLKERVPASLIYFGSDLRLKLYRLLGKSR